MPSPNLPLRTGSISDGPSSDALMCAGMSSGPSTVWVQNAAPDVRRDFESWFNEAVPEDAPYWRHTQEGPDDMPAHIKASLLGPSLTLPVRDGEFAVGTWQGIYLCEHRDHGGARSLLVTLFGDG